MALKKIINDSKVCPKCDKKQLVILIEHANPNTALYFFKKVCKSCGYYESKCKTKENLIKEGFIKEGEE